MRRDDSSCSLVTLKKKEKLMHDDQKKHKLHSSEELFSLVTQFLSLILKRVSREEEEHEMLKC
jgi:hypothetical protein